MFIATPPEPVDPALFIAAPPEPVDPALFVELGARATLPPEEHAAK
jgi:hypothetical protein